MVKHGPCTMNRPKLGKCSPCQHLQKAILYNSPPVVEDYLTITYENVKTLSSYNATKEFDKHDRPKPLQMDGQATRKVQPLQALQENNNREH